MRCKPCFLLFCAAACFLGMGSADAQEKVLYVGGQLGIQAVSEYASGVSGSSSSLSSISINPDFGFILKDRTAFGLRLSYSSIGGENYDFNASVDGLDGLSYSGHGRFRGIGVAPYVRRMLCSFGNFGLWLEGDLSFNYSCTEDDQLFVRQGGVSVFPLVTWNPGNHFTFYASLEKLSAGYERMYVYTTEREYYVSDFGFNFDARSIARLGDISIGVYYAF